MSDIGTSKDQAQMKRTSQSTTFRPGRAYGTPDAGNGRNGLAENYYFVLETDNPIFRITGSLTHEQFNYLAERLGTPKLVPVAERSPSHGPSGRGGLHQPDRRRINRAHSGRSRGRDMNTPGHAISKVDLQRLEKLRGMAHVWDTEDQGKAWQEANEAKELEELEQYEERRSELRL